MFCHWNEELWFCFFSEVYFVGVLLSFVNTRKIMSDVFITGLASPCGAQYS